MSKKKTVFKIILFIVIFVLCWLLLQNIFIEKYRADEFYGERFKSYSKEPKDTIDVLFLGSSPMLDDVNPNIIWHDAGITSFNISTIVNVPMAEYYTLRYALKYQKPKVLVFDLGGIADKRNPDDQTWEYTYRAVSHELPDKELSREMRKEASKLSDHRASWYLPLLRYHDRWSDLKQQDFDSAYRRREYLAHQKGSATFAESIDQSWWNEDLLSEGNSSEITDGNEYIDKIIKLCKDNNIQIMVLVPPQDSLIKEKVDIIEKTAKENGYNCILFKTKSSIEALGIDMSKDFSDSGHLSDSGQIKFSKFVGTYLKEHYDLPDHRGDSAYESWNKSYKENMEYIESLRKEAAEKDAQDHGSAYNQ